MNDFKVLIKNKDGGYGYEHKPKLNFTYKKTDNGMVFSVELQDIDMTYYNDISEIHVEKGSYTVATIKFD